MGQLNLDIHETNSREAVAILGDGQRAGDAPDVAPTLGAVGTREPILRDHVGDPDPAAGPSTRPISASTLSFSGDRLTTQFEITTSTLASSSGIFSMSP